MHDFDGESAIPFGQLLEPQETPAYLISGGIYSRNLSVPLHADKDHRLQSMASEAPLRPQPQGGRLRPDAL